MSRAQDIGPSPVLPCLVRIFTSAKQEMKDKGLTLEQPNAIVKAMIRPNAMTHKTSSNVAEMMINGTTMGIIEIRYNSNAIGANNAAMPLAEEFYNFMRA